MVFHLRRFLLAAAPGVFPVFAAAQTPSPAAPLDDFTGTYRYHGGSTITLVPGDSILFAILDEAKYPLRWIGGDRVINGPGDTIPFRRDAAGG